MDKQAIYRKINASKKIVREIMTAAASTITGASLGMIMGIVLLAVAASYKIILPLESCLWSTCLAGGAFSLLFRIPGDKEIPVILPTPKMGSNA